MTINEQTESNVSNSISGSYTDSVSSQQSDSSSVSTSSSQVEPIQKVYRVISRSGVNVRSEPSTNSNSLGVYSYGMVFNATEYDEKWVELEMYNDSGSAYIYNTEQILQEV